jgi:hypothetical protein
VNEDELWRSAAAGTPDIAVGVGKPLIAMLYPNFRGNDGANKLETQVWYAREDRAQPLIDSATQQPVRIYTEFASVAAALSADGSRFITHAATSRDSSLSYLLIDLSSGRAQPLSSVSATPFRYRSSDLFKAVWSPEGSEVAVTQLDLAAGSNTSTPRRCSIGVVNVRTGAARCVMMVERDSPCSARFVG